MQSVNTEVLQSIFKGDGYFLGLHFEPQEHQTLKQIITDQWLRKIDEKYPALTKQFEEVGIENYHTLAHLVDHSTLWPKKARMLSKADSERARSLGFFKNLQQYLGNYYVADYEALGYGEMTWRLVRPNQENDIGPMHQDTWFTEMNSNFKLPEDRERVSFWTAVVTEPGLSGLRVAPGTQNQDFPYHNEERFGMIKPVIDVKEEDLNIVPCLMNPGDVILFSPRVLHGGMVSRGTKCRISLECSIFFEKSLLE